ncbi:DDE-type integrase/transposase/recombinase, partial [Bifidobacterium bifidum]|nr:DDE-type integrase/transposase/recombinase [Bifidobacterium bifidum]
VRLHAILDLYGQRPAAWLISPTETREAAIKVFNQAAKASGTTPEMIHTDRGAAYTSTNYNEALRQEKVRHSLSAPETPANNAVMEHWWADFKSIWLEHRPKAQTLAELQEQVRAGIMYFTNQFISAKRNDQTVAEYYHDLVG